MKHSQPTPTANRFSSSGSGRWMLATPQPVTFPGGNHSCPAECTAWWDLKFCTRSRCSRPGSWWESWSSATETLGFPKIPCWGHVHLRFWGSCDMALWASMSHSFVYVSFFLGFEKKIDVFHLVSSTHHPTFPDHPRCQGTVKIAYQSWHSGPYSQLPKALSFEHRVFSNSMGDENLGLELEDWMIKLLPFGIAYFQVLSWNADVPQQSSDAVKIWVTSNSHQGGQLPTRDLSILC